MEAQGRGRTGRVTEPGPPGSQSPSPWPHANTEHLLYAPSTDPALCGTPSLLGERPSAHLCPSQQGLGSGLSGDPKAKGWERHRGASAQHLSPWGKGGAGGRPAAGGGGRGAEGQRGWAELGGARRSRFALLHRRERGAAGWRAPRIWLPAEWGAGVGGRPRPSPRPARLPAAGAPRLPGARRGRGRCRRRRRAGVAVRGTDMQAARGGAGWPGRAGRGPDCGRQRPPGATAASPCAAPGRPAGAAAMHPGPPRAALRLWLGCVCLALVQAGKGARALGEGGSPQFPPLLPGTPSLPHHCSLMPAPASSLPS